MSVGERLLAWLAISLMAAVVTYISWDVLPLGGWLGHEDAPAWVQAIGSIVAIFAAVAVVQLQHSNERRLDRDRQRASEVATLSAAHSVLRIAHAAVAEAATCMSESDAAARYFSDAWADAGFVHIGRVLDGYPVHQVPDGALQVQFLKAARAFSAAESLLGVVSGNSRWGISDVMVADWRRQLRLLEGPIALAVADFECEIEAVVKAP